MKKRICHQTLLSHQYPVRLIQTGKDRFIVEYGKQIRTNLNYEEAALEYGSCIMHALACEGLLDNRAKKGER